MVSNIQISYNRHYVKWMVNWWKIPVFKIAHKSFYVKYHFNVIPKFMNLCLNSLSFFTHESYRVCRRPTFPEIRSIASQGNIEQNEVYMIFIMLSKSNEFGKKVRGDMAFVRSGNNCNEKLCYCALYKCARLCATFCV